MGRPRKTNNLISEMDRTIHTGNTDLIKKRARAAGIDDLPNIKYRLRTEEDIHKACYEALTVLRQIFANKKQTTAYRLQAVKIFLDFTKAKPVAMQRLEIDNDIKISWMNEPVTEIEYKDVTLLKDQTAQIGQRTLLPRSEDDPIH